jgi:hypothetical protein
MGFNGTVYMLLFLDDNLKIGLVHIRTLHSSVLFLKYAYAGTTLLFVNFSGNAREQFTVFCTVRL